MPLETHTIRLGDARDRLDNRLDELADRTAAADGDPPTAVLEEATAIETKRLPGVLWGLQEFGAEAAVEIAALSHGDMAEVTDRIAGASAEQFGHGGVDGAATTFFVAAGLVDAPFLEERNPSIEAAAPIVGGRLQPQFVQWLEHEIDARTSIDSGNVTPFAERVAARETSEPE